MLSRPTLVCRRRKLSSSKVPPKILVRVGVRGGVRARVRIQVRVRARVRARVKVRGGVRPHEAHESPASPPCAMKPGMIRWNLVPWKVKGAPFRVVLPVARPTKLLTVFGTALPNMPITIRPAACPSIVRSMKTRCVTFGSAADKDG
eukprot:scaffold55967_cov61-Phaeocystis_antarctica.AAC.3